MGMGRRPAEGVVRDEVLCVRLTSADLSELDRVRGETKRSDFIRAAIRSAVAVRQ